MSHMPAQAAAPARPWRPSAFLSLQLALHAAALVLLLRMPAAWPWALGTVLLSQLLLMAASLWPRGRALGPNLVRLPADAAQAGAVAITIDDGPDPELTPQVLQVLAQYGAVATFFCIGARAQAQPDLCRRMVGAGHHIENHGQQHPTLCALSGPGGWRREVWGGQGTLQRITGRAPRFYRAVAGLRNPFLDPLLHASGLRLASWTRRGFDTRERDPARVLQRLTRQLAAGDILLLHDGHCARAADGRAVILHVLPALLELLRARGLHTVTLAQACKLD